MVTLEDKEIDGEHLLNDVSLTALKEKRIC